MWPNVYISCLTIWHYSITSMSVTIATQFTFPFIIIHLPSFIIIINHHFTWSEFSAPPRRCTLRCYGGHLQQGAPGAQRVRGHVLLQAGLLRRLAGGAGRVPAALSRLGHRHQPACLQPLPALQRQGRRAGAVQPRPEVRLAIELAQIDVCTVRVLNLPSQGSSKSYNCKIFNWSWGTLTDWHIARMFSNPGALFYPRRAQITSCLRRDTDCAGDGESVWRRSPSAEAMLVRSGVQRHGYQKKQKRVCVCPVRIASGRKRKRNRAIAGKTGRRPCPCLGVRLVQSVVVGSSVSVSFSQWLSVVQCRSRSVSGCR